MTEPKMKMIGGFMYRIRKVLNHNAVIVIDDEGKNEYLMIGKGAGFGKKPAERIEPSGECQLYSMTPTTERGDARDIIKSVEPECLEIAGAIMDEAEKVFGRIDRKIIFPLADHLAFAIRRAQSGELMKNPLNPDIRTMFYSEYKVATCAYPQILSKFGVKITEDEVGLIALHVHASIVDEKVSDALQTARIVRECISLIEEQTGEKLEVTSLGYNRMMNHIRYMVMRIHSGEKLSVNLNDYMKSHYPQAYSIAETVCNDLKGKVEGVFQTAEIGYMAMHIQRVIGDEETDE